MRFTNARWDDWVGEPLRHVSEDAATVDLARWYLRSHGPATFEDFRWWSGLGTAATRAAIEAAEPDEVETGRGPMFTIGDRLPPRPPRGARLLPAWDTALIGHADRARIVDEAWVSHVYDPPGNATSCVLVDGKAAGLWQLDGLERLVVRVAPFDSFDESTWAEVESEAERVGEALEAEALAVERCPLPSPLQTAPRNRFLSPLADVR